jgi:hypothetical protein
MRLNLRIWRNTQQHRVESGLGGIPFEDDRLQSRSSGGTHRRRRRRPLDFLRSQSFLRGLCVLCQNHGATDDAQDKYCIEI